MMLVQCREREAERQTETPRENFQNKNTSSLHLSAKKKNGWIPRPQEDCRVLRIREDKGLIDKEGSRTQG